MKGDHAFHVGSKVLDLKCCWNAGFLVCVLICRITLKLTGVPTNLDRFESSWARWKGKEFNYLFLLLWQHFSFSK